MRPRASPSGSTPRACVSTKFCSPTSTTTMCRMPPDFRSMVPSSAPSPITPLISPSKPPPATGACPSWCITTRWTSESSPMRPSSSVASPLGLPMFRATRPTALPFTSRTRVWCSPATPSLPDPSAAPTCPMAVTNN